VKRAPAALEEGSAADTPLLWVARLYGCGCCDRGVQVSPLGLVYLRKFPTSESQALSRLVESSLKTPPPNHR
jgi:hypothetical protein